MGEERNLLGAERNPNFSLLAVRGKRIAIYQTSHVFLTYEALFCC